MNNHKSLIKVGVVYRGYVIVDCGIQGYSVTSAGAHVFWAKSIEDAKRILDTGLIS
jgi:hypothetical protein